MAEHHMSHVDVTAGNVFVTGACLLTLSFRLIILRGSTSTSLDSDPCVGPVTQLSPQPRRSPPPL